MSFGGGGGGEVDGGVSLFIESVIFYKEINTPKFYDSSEVMLAISRRKSSAVSIWSKTE